MDRKLITRQRLYKILGNDKLRVRCLAQRHNSLNPVCLEGESLDPGPNLRTTRPQRFSQARENWRRFGFLWHLIGPKDRTPLLVYKSIGTVWIAFESPFSSSVKLLLLPRTFLLLVFLLFSVFFYAKNKLCIFFTLIIDSAFLLTPWWGLTLF